MYKYEYNVSFLPFLYHIDYKLTVFSLPYSYNISLYNIGLYLLFKYIIQIYFTLAYLTKAVDLISKK